MLASCLVTSTQFEQVCERKSYLQYLFESLGFLPLDHHRNQRLNSFTVQLIARRLQNTQYPCTGDRLYLYSLHHHFLIALAIAF